MLNFFYSEGEEVLQGPVSDVPENLRSLLLPLSAPAWTVASFGRCLCQQITNGQYCICVTDLFIEKPVTLIARSTQPVLAFTLPVSGSFICHPDYSASIIMQESNCYTISLTQDVEAAFHLSRGHHHVVFLVVTPNVFSDYAARLPAIKWLKEEIDAHLVTDPQRLETPFTLRTKAALHDIENYNSLPEQSDAIHQYMQGQLTRFFRDYANVLQQPAELRVRYGMLLKTFAERLLQVRVAVDEHEGKPLTVEQLAKQFGLNTRQLKTGFREMFGTSVDRYQLDIRMERATLLLISTSNTIELICDMVGYEDRSSFTRRFKPVYKMTPQQYRIKYKEAAHPKKRSDRK